MAGLFLSTGFTFGAVAMPDVCCCTAALLNLLNVGFKVEMLAVSDSVVVDVV